ncbi:MAG TPA: YIP1 family protein [Candidatus Elarobacter sp.]|nr:YIP1 family protein [Candidatus Elarobacter sp.]
MGWLLSTSEPVPKNSSLINALDIIIAPKAAFRRIRLVPAWGWAFLVATLLGIAGFLLAQPATMHAFNATAPALYAPAVAKMPPEQQQAALTRMVAFGRTLASLQWIFAPIGLLFGALLSSIVMLIANAISRGDGGFKKFYAVAITCAVVTSLGIVLNGVISLVRGPDAYDTLQSVQTGLPSLALLAPSAGSKLSTFLATFNVTTLWATALSAIGMTIVGNIKPPIAWTAAIVSLLVAAALGAAFVP